MYKNKVKCKHQNELEYKMLDHVYFVKDETSGIEDCFLNLKEALDAANMLESLGSEVTVEILC